MADLLLPKLKTQDIKLQPGTPGQWHRQTEPSFKNVAISLDLPVSSSNELDINSIPTVWAYPITLELAAQDESHILREGAIASWRGMLAAIALAEYLSRKGQKLEAHLVELDKLAGKRDRLANCLQDMLPESKRKLYQIFEDDIRDKVLNPHNPWRRFYLFTWDNGDGKKEPVGITTPGSIVCPATEGDWEGLPWFDQNSKKLRSPEKFIDPEQKQLLCKWLGSLVTEISKVDEYKGDAGAAGQISGLIKAFCKDLGGDDQATAKITADELGAPNFFGNELTFGILKAITRPVKIPSRDSAVEIQGSLQAEKAILIDPNVSEVWPRSPESIVLFDPVTLADYLKAPAAKLAELQKKVTCLQPADLLLDELYFIPKDDGEFLGLPLALPNGCKDLKYGSQDISIILPLKPILFTYFSPTELVNIIQVGLDNDGKVKLAINLTLSGGDYLLEKTYDLKPENKFSKDLSVLEIYRSNTNKYYTLCCDQRDIADQFDIPNPEETYSSGKTYQISKFNRFPEYINCKRDKKSVGTLILAAPTTSINFKDPSTFQTQAIKSVDGIVWFKADQLEAHLKNPEIRLSDLLGAFTYIQGKDVFLDELYFIQKKDALMNVLMPSGAGNLSHGGESITIILPLKSAPQTKKPLLLEYFPSADELTKNMKVGLESNGSKVKLTVNLPLLGATHALEKIYDLKEQNKFDRNLPVFEIYPNFRVEGWKRYYVLHHDVGYDTFDVEIPDPKNKHEFKDGDGKCQIYHMESFPESLICKRKELEVGTILLNLPQTIEKKQEDILIVSVDFGTSSTNAYERLHKDDNSTHVQFSSLHYQISRSGDIERLSILRTSFIPDKMDLPVPTLLSIKNKKVSEDLQLIVDARIFVANSPQELEGSWLKSNLKWVKDSFEQKAYVGLFLEQLAFQIAARSIVEYQARTIQWSLSYPSVFSDDDKNKYLRSWNSISQSLQQDTGLELICPDLSRPENLRYFRSESLASGYFFVGNQKEGLHNSACIDIGGGTSDICIWQMNNDTNKRSIVHQCSVKLAGRDLLSNIIAEMILSESSKKVKPEASFICKIELVPRNIDTALIEDLFNTKSKELIIAKLDFILRSNYGVRWLKDKREKLSYNSDLRRFSQILAIGFAGLYFYVGMILNVLAKEGVLNKQEVASVIFGGNGSRLLQWLCPEGQYQEDCDIDKLLKIMLVWGSQFPSETADSSSISQSQRPKDEVADGLLTYLQGIEDKDKRQEVKGISKLISQAIDTKEEDRIIAGEWCRINKMDFEWNQRVEIKAKDRVTSYNIIDNKSHPNLIQLPRFLWYFHEALVLLKIEDIDPLSDKTYDHSKIPKPDFESDFSSAIWDDSQNICQYNSKLWNDVNAAIADYLAEGASLESPFIIALKSLMKVLTNKWVGGK